jgi:hypothetical protein
VELRASELAMILDGIDVSKLKRVPRYANDSILSPYIMTFNRRMSSYCMSLHAISSSYELTSIFRMSYYIVTEYL